MENTLEIFEKYIHTNACNDEGGWFAFFTPDGEIGDCEMMKSGMYVNGCETEEEAIKELVKLACEALIQKRENDLKKEKI